jgi:hypothetical protein
MVELGDFESHRIERERYPEDIIVKEENEIKIMVMVMATEKDELKISTTNQYMSNHQKIKENRLKIQQRILNAEYAIQVNTN